MVTSYNVISQDGFIADKNWNEDFIPDDTWPEFIKLINESDAVVLGRKTYEIMYRDYSRKIIDEFEKTKTKKVIISSNPSFRAKEIYMVAKTPEEVMGLGERILLSGGPILNESFLRLGLINKFIRLIIPVQLGEGIRPFLNELKLITEASQKLSDGTILQTYSMDSSSKVND